MLFVYDPTKSCSVKELLLVVESSYQVFDYARKKKFSEHVFSLMCHSASYVLHAIAQVDEAASKDSDNMRWWDSRNKTLQKMKKALHEWIVCEDVIGGSVFGGSVPLYSFRRKYRGKEELQVYNLSNEYLFNIYVKPGNKNQMLGTHLGFEINSVNNRFFMEAH